MLKLTLVKGTDNVEREDFEKNTYTDTIKHAATYIYITLLSKKYLKETIREGKKSDLK